MQWGSASVIFAANVSSLDIFSGFYSICCKNSCSGFPMLNSLDSVLCWFFRSFMKLLVLKDLVFSPWHFWIWWTFCVEISAEITHWELQMFVKPPFSVFPFGFLQYKVYLFVTWCIGCILLCAHSASLHSATLVAYFRGQLILDNKSSISHPAASPGQTLCV